MEFLLLIIVLMLDALLYFDLVKDIIDARRETKAIEARINKYMGD